MNVLECSSKGDKRFSAFYAKVKWNGNYANIETHYQNCKQFSEKVDNPKGKKPLYIDVNSYKLDAKFLTPFYKMLWVKYLDENPKLVEYASEFDDFHDIFKGKNTINCQADVIKQYVKRGRESILHEPLVMEFNKLINNDEYMIHNIGIIVCGSRHLEFDNSFYILSNFMMLVLSDLKRKGIIDEEDLSNITIVQGGAKGADRLAKKFARTYKIEQKEFEAEWDTYGKSAGYRRNVDMANYVKDNFDYSVCVAFPIVDVACVGTDHMIAIAKKSNFDKVYVKNVYGGEPFQ